MGENMSAEDAATRQALRSELNAKNFTIHQPTDPALFTPVPKPSMQPVHWKAEDIKESLERIGQQVKLESGGVRRTLRLTNPGIEYGTTPTFWASIQYILPGEVATAHRHTATALRFIMEGEGADTIVDGEQYKMNEGDLVFTPSWTWHDHEHLGEKPMVWLDVLDINLVRSLEAVFFEASENPRQVVNERPDASFREFGSGIMRPVNPQHAIFDNPLLVYPQKKAEEAIMLAAEIGPDPHDDTLMEYINPMTGGSANGTIGTLLQRLRPGIKLEPHRHTGSSIYYVLRGNGRTVVDGQVFDWGKGDFFAVPPWAEHAHENRSDENDCLMFQVNDFPVLKSLGLWREQSGSTVKG